ncbi:D-2-hydroxyacid dehydrogenase [Paenibacillus montanisoli]|uniref:D-2-hydroxyacid dehydrogenase n=2 Tax=Paenibacillus montanisoli TaxID=2081970 RepID=A0A328U3X3_9BACL|nr:D-2-hydroxyacid dehydrogenase [Paenibacillus montanisoli]
MGTIVSVHSFNQKQAAAIQEACPGYRYVDVSGFETEEARAALKNAEIILGFNRDVLKIIYADDNQLRWLQNLGAGVDQIPLERLQSLGVMLSTASGVHPNAISESIFAMLLSLTRKVHAAIRNQQTQTWKPSKETGEAHGKTISIIGAGAIGTETAKIAQAFGMRVLGIRRTGESAQWFDAMHTVDRLNEVLAQSDYVVNCLPLTNETRHLFGGEQFAAMKTSSIYINIGRGGTTDTAALIDALQQGRIAGAGLDVFEQEPLPKEHPLWKLENVILTPHETGNTPYYMDRALTIVIENLKHYISNGKPCRNMVNWQTQY